MIDYDNIKEDLRKIITPNSVFVCIGSSNTIFDSFGPICGDLLRRKNIPYYGDLKENINGINLNSKIETIYNELNYRDENIVSIDACVTKYDYKLNTVKVSDIGIKPASGMGRYFDRIGCSSIIMYTILSRDLDQTIYMYRKYGVGSYVGKRYDLSDRIAIRKVAIKITDIISELYLNKLY